MRFLLVLSLLLAGCSGPAETSGLEAGDAEPATAERVLENVVSSHAFKWDGQTKEGFWVCDSASTTGTCLAGQQIQPDGEFSWILPIENFTSMNFNVTWSPTDASQLGLVFAVYDALGALIGSSSGQSPLQIAVVDSMPGPTTLTLMAWPEGKTPTEPSVFVDATRQPFHVEGSWARTDQEWIDSP